MSSVIWRTTSTSGKHIVDTHMVLPQTKYIDTSPCNYQILLDMSRFFFLLLFFAFTQGKTNANPWYTMVIRVDDERPSEGRISIGDCILSANGQPIQISQVGRITLSSPVVQGGEIFTFWFRLCRIVFTKRNRLKSCAFLKHTFWK